MRSGPRGPAGLASSPVPISTSGFDNASYLTSTQAVTKDPETGIRNSGLYRGQVKSPTSESSLRRR